MRVAVASSHRALLYPTRTLVFTRVKWKLLRDLGRKYIAGVQAQEGNQPQVTVTGEMPAGLAQQAIRTDP